MCISSSSHQADEVYTNVYTNIVVFFEPDTNRTKVMLTYQENGREKDYFLLPAIVSLEGLCPLATLFLRGLFPSALQSSSVPHLYDNRGKRGDTNVPMHISPNVPMCQCTDVQMYRSDGLHSV